MKRLGTCVFFGILFMSSYLFAGIEYPAKEPEKLAKEIQDKNGWDSYSREKERLSKKIIDLQNEKSQVKASRDQVFQVVSSGLHLLRLDADRYLSPIAEQLGKLLPEMVKPLSPLFNSSRRDEDKERDYEKLLVMLRLNDVANYLMERIDDRHSSEIFFAAFGQKRERFLNLLGDLNGMNTRETSFHHEVKHILDDFTKALSILDPRYFEVVYGKVQLENLNVRLSRIEIEISRTQKELDELKSGNPKIGFVNIARTRKEGNNRVIVTGSIMGDVFDRVDLWVKLPGRNYSLVSYADIQPGDGEKSFSLSTDKDIDNKAELKLKACFYGYRCENFYYIVTDSISVPGKK
ncbi:MAG: hypothetical protein HYS98_05705 [Deltaproteobacteria bacterium]|nr:hypothetical protein [Deltaproteobacteria bacterium]